MRKSLSVLFSLFTGIVFLEGCGGVVLSSMSKERMESCVSGYFLFDGTCLLDGSAPSLSGIIEFDSNSVSGFSHSPSFSVSGILVEEGSGI